LLIIENAIIIYILASNLYVKTPTRECNSMKNSTLVYSTGLGRIKNSDSDKSGQAPKGDGIVRLKRITKGRKGKGVSTIEGLEMSGPELKTLCSELKKQCGCGGSVKGFVIEIQGDVREKLKGILESKGHKVKLAGG
jgi:translation initiation factor 1